MSAQEKSLTAWEQSEYTVSDITWMAIYAVICREEPVRTVEIADNCGLSGRHISNIITEMIEKGLVDWRKEGRYTYYFVNYE